MLRDLTIQNYRCFKDFHVDGLARVNLIVGANNSGKTCFLEAIHLLASQRDPQRLIEHLRQRGEFEEIHDPPLPGETENYRVVYQIRHLFYGHKPEPKRSIRFASSSDIPLSLEVRFDPSRLDVAQLMDDRHRTSWALTFEYGDGTQSAFPVHAVLAIEPQPFPPAQSRPTPHKFLTTANLGYRELADLWDSIALTPEEERAVQALRILEPDVERISFARRPTISGGVRIKMRGREAPIPLGTLGDGMRRILTLAIVGATAQNGVLLVDEIDTGLYYEAQARVWQLLLEMARHLNMQIFATTHSSDCVRAFQEALAQSAEPADGLLLRMSLRGEQIKPVLYSPDELAVAMQQDIEVR